MFMNESGDAEIILEPDKSRSSYMYTADLMTQICVNRGYSVKTAVLACYGLQNANCNWF